MNTLDYIKAYAQLKRNFLESLGNPLSSDVLIERNAIIRAYDDIVKEINRIEDMMPVVAMPPPPPGA